jgi:hypothetical protein
MLHDESLRQGILEKAKALFGPNAAIMAQMLDALGRGAAEAVAEQLRSAAEVVGNVSVKTDGHGFSQSGIAAVDVTGVATVIIDQMPDTDYQISLTPAQSMGGFEFWALATERTITQFKIRTSGHPGYDPEFYWEVYYSGGRGFGSVAGTIQ